MILVSIILVFMILLGSAQPVVRYEPELTMWFSPSSRFSPDFVTFRDSTTQFPGLQPDNETRTVRFDQLIDWVVAPTISRAALCS